MEQLNDLIKTGTIKTIGGVIFLAGFSLQLWKFALSGLLRNGIKMNVRGNDIVHFTGTKAKSYGFLFLLAALSMTWILIQIILFEFSITF